MTARARRSRTAARLFGLTSLLLPAALAWRVAWEARYDGALHRTASYALAGVWCVLFVSLVVRFADAIVRHRRATSRDVAFLDRLDVLTPAGSALAWLASGAIALSVWIGWASFSVLGLLGIGIFHFAAIWALWMLDGDDPFRRSSLSRRFTSERVVEGAAVIEELHLSGPRIPPGFRLFATGRVGPRWTTSRYVVEGSDDGSEIRLQSDVGPALRGEHEAEPLEVWLQDILGLCRSRRLRVGRASLVVLPRARALRGAEEILRAHVGPGEPRRALVAPSEGSLLLRAYQQGDDARRIHWARSAGGGPILVRTPDEVPHDRRSVRVVLDTYLSDPDGFTCPAPAELLDTLVAVWLGVARTFVDAGVRVDLVVASGGRVQVTPVRRVAGLASRAQDLGARARWQDVMPLERLLTRQPSVVVSYRHQPLPPDAGATSWVLAREWAWVGFDRKPQVPSFVLLPHPMGSPENASPRREAERLSYRRQWVDHARFTRSCGDTAPAGEGRATFLATPSLGGAIHVEKLS